MARMGVLEDWCSCHSGEAITHRAFYYGTYERLQTEEHIEEHIVSICMIVNGYLLFVAGKAGVK